MSDPYDPQAPDERHQSNQYISRKDVRIVAIVLLVLAIIGWPVYIYMLKGVNTSLCAKNMRKIGSALQQYISDNDDHMPYAYETTDFFSTDIKLHGGYANTWQFQINQYTNDWKIFKCPGADEAENSRISNTSSVEESSYGMLNAYSGALFSGIAYPNQKIVIGETAKSGVNGTVDPLPLLAGGKPLADDGPVIGFDNDQDHPNSATKNATRLAFPDSVKTGFDTGTATRHPGGIHFLFADGSMHVLKGSAGRVNPSSVGSGLWSYGLWDVPPKPTLLTAPKSSSHPSPKPPAPSGSPSIAVGK
jgi:prepilin-type processing-associated H-X9-DG protein